MIAFSEIRAQAWKYGALVLSALGVALLLACMFLQGRATRANVRAASAEQRAQASEAVAKALRETLETERQNAKRANEIAAKYEQEKLDAEASAKRTADDLRAGNLQLRKQWQGCEARVPEADGGAGQPYAAADDRAESAGRIVRAAAEADAQIRALQDFIRAERK